MEVSCWYINHVVQNILPLSHGSKHRAYHLKDFFFFFSRKICDRKVILCRIGFSNHTGATALDWTLGAFIFQSVLKPPEIEPENEVKIVGSDSVTYFSLFAIILIALLAMFFVLQLRKPQLKIIYDLEKGHYTRVPR